MAEKLAKELLQKKKKTLKVVGGKVVKVEEGPWG